MFTGIVTDIGTIDRITPLNEGIRLRVATNDDPATIALGASISHAGVCLTVTALPDAGSNERWHEVEAWEEALRLTTAGAWQEGTRVNIERALKIGDELGGHIVSGHVDGMAEIVSVEEEGDAVRYTLRAPEGLRRPRRHLADRQQGRWRPVRRAADPPFARSHHLGRAQGRRFREFRG